MICNPCRKATDFQAQSLSPNSEKTLMIMRDFHAMCTSCDCQHRVTGFPAEDAIKGGGNGDSNGTAAAGTAAA